MELEGTIKIIEETKTYGNNGFRKRIMVLNTEMNSEYPQSVSIDFVQDKTELLDKLSEGESVKVYINIGGREWVNPQGETKYFNSITGWRIENMDQPTSFIMPPVPPKDAFEPTNDLKEQDQDDLPF